MSRPTAKCGHCSGTGRIPLPPQAIALLDVVRRHGPASGAALHREIPLAARTTGVTGTCMALRRLEDSGLVVSERQGRAVLWRISR